MTDSKKAPANEPTTNYEQALEKGFIGSEIDQTSNEAYTVGGVLEGKPTPESDATLAAQARESAGLSDADRDAGKK